MRAGKGLAPLAVALMALALPSMASAATQTLTAEKQGTGTGTVTSSPPGIAAAPPARPLSPKGRWSCA